MQECQTNPKHFPWQPIDRGITAAFFLVALLISIRLVHWHTPPAEDALMLLRYSTHLAHEQGITWNVGDPPVEGATDFLWMVTVALFTKLFHSGAIVTARILLAVSNAATVALLYVSSRKLFDSGRPLAIALAVYLITGPGIPLVSLAFSPPFYSLVAMGAWWFACRIVTSDSTAPRIWGFALLSLATGLVRPDGVFFAFFMLLALVVALFTPERQTEIPRIVAITAAVFLLLGGAYFLWRWHYFGYLFPNPFYRKGGGHLYLDSLHRSTLNVFKLLMPVLPLAILGLIKGEWRRTTFVFLPAFLFSIVWVLLNNENNAAMRFQYIVLPITLMGIPLVVKALRTHYPQAFDFGLATRQQLAIATLATAIFASIHWRILLFYPIPELGSGAGNIASGLHQWRDRNYTIAVTEAGVIPYFSDWRAIDAFGLNDAVIMHDPHGLTEAYLDANHPAVIMLHLTPDVTGLEGFHRAWLGQPPATSDVSQYMVVLAQYAVTHDYELAARWGDVACNVHIWYVRRGLPESQAIVDLIRRDPHFFLDSRYESHNYLNDPPPPACSDTDFRISFER